MKSGRAEKERAAEAAASLPRIEAFFFTIAIKGEREGDGRGERETGGKGGGRRI